MKAAIVGYGAMGRETGAALRRKGIPFVSIDPVAADADFRDITAESLAGVDVALDFTRPQAVRGNLERYCAAGVDVVMGTTGWYNETDSIRALVEKGGIGFIWASNFSIGIQMFLRIVAEASRLVDAVSEYDVFIREIHHARKADSPSGTSLSVAGVVMENIARKTVLVTDTLNRRIEPNELHLTSARGGAVPGVHEVVIDGEADTIELRHSARNRSGFASGAVMAAEFVHGKKGFFSMDDLMASLAVGKKGDGHV
jgi:4-hydroxy-tetrahydrodipicolinate reductase